MSEFDQIRPYTDGEVRGVLGRLMEDTEFVDAIAKLKLPRPLKAMAPVFRALVRGRLRKELSQVYSVRDFQERIESYLSHIIDTTVTEWTVSGLDKLDNQQSHLFISNHRDISMDPALVNWALYQNGFSTLRIAIGDNLLTKPFASDLMRLNKSFIVNRSATAPREKLKAAKLLSQYIRHSIEQDGENIWIAQREGRAKDGIDKTNSAIIGMFGLSKEKKADFAEHIRNLNVVPVSISYEYDPCDMDKARELYEKSVNGEYVKSTHEDVQSIAKGITGYKGRVHLSFGEPLTKPFVNADEVTQEIDEQIKDLYKLQLTNCFAYEMLESASPAVPVGKDDVLFTELDISEEREFFKQRVAQCPSAHRDVLLKGYANPVYVKLGVIKLEDV